MAAQNTIAHQKTYAYVTFPCGPDLVSSKENVFKKTSADELNSTFRRNDLPYVPPTVPKHIHSISLIISYCPHISPVGSGSGESAQRPQQPFHEASSGGQTKAGQWLGSLLCISSVL